MLASLLLLAAPSVASDAYTYIQVPGVGEVSLRDARMTCESGEPQGSVARAPEYTRTAVFADLAVELLEHDDSVRRAYFRYQRNGERWPRDDADAHYVPRLPMSPRGVPSACLEAAKYYILRADALTQVCRQSKDDCYDALAAIDKKLVKKALRKAEKDRETEPFQASSSDPVLANLYALNADRFRNPSALLDTACKWPELMAERGLFIDPHDLAASRMACLQQMALLGQKPRFLSLPCKTGWEDLSAAEWAKTVPADSSDVGVGVYQYDRFGGKDPAGGPFTPNTAVYDIERRLHRMDPTPGDCDDRTWGTIWKETLLTVWRDRQAVQACRDRGLDLRTRSQHCLSVVNALQSECDDQDAASCFKLGQAHKDGIGTRRDRIAAAEAFGRACRQKLIAGCSALGEMQDELRQAFDKKVANSDVEGAKRLFGILPAVLGEEWETEAKPKLDALVGSGEETP